MRIPKVRIPKVVGFVAGSWLIGAAIHAASWPDLTRATDASYSIYFIPFVFAVAAGNVPQPSEIGLVAGMIVQWTVVGFAALAIYHCVRRVRAPVKREET
jgi:peptidoglycan/LPS O-acetylase OafA/YrhL